MNYYNYFTEIEETFVRRRGKHLFLSPLDWALIDAWKERGIPLHIVIRSIESVFDVFDKQPAGTRTIKTLFYCREEIESQYAEWLTSQKGRSSEQEATESIFTLEQTSAHITKSIEVLKRVEIGSLWDDIARAVTRLEELSANLSEDFETVDKTLGDIETLIDRAMLTNLDPEHLSKTKKEVTAELRPYKSEMEAEDYKNTFQLMYLKRLREDIGIPRLGLFYL